MVRLDSIAIVRWATGLPGPAPTGQTRVRQVVVSPNVWIRVGAAALASPVCSLSVVSHGHGVLVHRMLMSFVTSGFVEHTPTEVLLTLNVVDDQLQALLADTSWPFSLKVVLNRQPKGFGSNHNQAFREARGEWFVVVNPDILWLTRERASAGECQPWNGAANAAVFVPRQLDVQGHAQDSFRELVTPTSAVVRTIQRCFGRRANAGVARSVCTSDWVNAACLIIRAQVYRSLRGFDERYFMYCEDADFCLRLQLAGHTIADAGFAVIHDAQRNTFRQPRHLWWHLTSLLRFWCSGVFWRYWLTKQRKAGSRSHTGHP